MAAATIEKKVGETLILGFRYHSPALASDETITAASVSAQAGINAGAVSVSSPQVSCPVSGGTGGYEYTIRFTSTTSQGQVFIDDYEVKVVA